MADNQPSDPQDVVAKITELQKDLEANPRELSPLEKRSFDILARTKNLLEQIDSGMEPSAPLELEFTIYWKHGERSVIKGTSIDHAFTRAGYGAGAVAAIDWYDNGNTSTHKWVEETKNWMRKELLIDPKA